MCSPLNCGTSNFPAEEYDIDELLNPCKPPKKAPKKMKKTKNPYADRGLDKFNALLSELESKKQKIYTQKGSQDISFIRFAYSSSGEYWKPIVVKTKGKIRSDHQEDRLTNNIYNAEKYQDHQEHHVHNDQTNGEIINKSRSRSFFKLENLRQPSFYLTMLLILILLLLAISSKTFAILCTTMGWYLRTLIDEASSSSNPFDRPLKKKEYTRKLSEGNFFINGSASPISVLDGPERMSPAAKHAHRKSW